MKLRTLLAASTAIVLAAPAVAHSMEVVTSTADSGEGSFRAALEAVAETGGQIVVAAEGEIAIDSPLEYTGTAPLYVFGNGQTVRAAGNHDLFASVNGGDLTITDLTFAGPGGFDIENRGDTDGVAGKGIFLDVAEDQTGLVALVLKNVTVSGVANHGIHVSDCDLADDCGGGGGGAGGGSEAGIILQLVDVTVDDAGNGKFDADGLRVDERGAGTINASISGSTFRNVGADGIELDEGQDGDVRVIMSGTVFEDNGAYCPPDLLGQFMPDQDEGEFEQGAAMPADIPQAPSGTPDDSCFEYEVGTYDDGSVEEFEIGIDVDDAFDVDEAGPGSIEAAVMDTRILNSFDEGLDYDEEGPGDISMVLMGTSASGNSDDGYKHSEEGPGSVRAIVVDASATDNGGVGFVFEEADGGDVTVSMMRSSTSGNDDGELGVEAVQEDDGTGQLQLMGSDIADGVEAEGVERNDM
jgi:hypothetical protein